MELEHPNSDASLVLIPYALDVLNAVGIVNGPSHQEIMIVNGKPVLIEVGARLHGGAGGYFGAAATVYSATDLFIDFLGDKHIFEQYKKNGSKYSIKTLYAKEIFLISEISGVVKTCNLEKILSSIKSFFELKCRIEVGDIISKTINLRTSPTSILLVNDKESLLRDEEIIYNMERAGCLYELH